MENKLYTAPRIEWTIMGLDSFNLKHCFLLQILLTAERGMSRHDCCVQGYDALAPHGGWGHACVYICVWVLTWPRAGPDWARVVWMGVRVTVTEWGLSAEMSPICVLIRCDFPAYLLETTWHKVVQEDKEKKRNQTRAFPSVFVVLVPANVIGILLLLCT